ncbi:hypothetical protein [Crystallibacter degradans]|uniref:hypothetical protein n=1 Tax=Crystallibacter degradans TaxID=2726743 RepID=UPI001473FFD8|nr:hypothetical protein [Arthrobacter sp. SF27]NMR31364.1 hypothetical protein [Arthrobacter sp. SF27]
MRKLILSVSGVLAVLALAGCSGGPEGVGALEQDATAGDALPAYARDAKIVPSSSRLLGEAAELKFYVAKPANASAASAVCVVVDRGHEQDWGSGCSQSAPVSLMYGGVEAMLVPDGFNAGKLVDEGWAQLHANLLVAGL